MNVSTPKFRVSFPNVFRPRKNEKNGKEEYSLMALFPKGADLSALTKACQEACEKKWGKDSSKWPKGLRSPIRDQAEREKEGVLPPECVAGAKFINMKSNLKPGVVDQNVQVIMEESEFYAGCYARASLSAYAYDQQGNKGVAFGLRNVQKMGDGEPLGTISRPEDDFKPIEGAGTPAGASSESIFQ